MWKYTERWHNWDTIAAGLVEKILKSQRLNDKEASPSS
jgi:hypothetical protein